MTLLQMCSSGVANLNQNKKHLETLVRYHILLSNKLMCKIGLVDGIGSDVLRG